jgi:DNA (cytosine-5)-methyltransferase 1
MCLNAGAMGRRDAETETLIPTTGAVFDDALGVAHSLRGEGFDASEDGTGRGTPLVPVHTAPTLRAGGNATGGTRPYGTDVDTCDSLIPVALNENQQGAVWGSDTFQALNKGGGKPGQGYPCVAYAIQERAVSENLENGPQGKGFQEGVAYTLEARNKVQSVAASAVRRLTPVECERLQGFPDDYTQIPWRKKPADECPDGPRYRALGNSMAVPVMSWLGQRIAAVEAIIKQEQEA